MSTEHTLAQLRRNGNTIRFCRCDGRPVIACVRQKEKETRTSHEKRVNAEVYRPCRLCGRTRNSWVIGLLREITVPA